MPHQKSVTATGTARTGAHCRLVDLRPAGRAEAGTTASSPLSCVGASCPACGAGGCHQHGSVKGHARYRCQNCYKIFSVSLTTPRIRRDEYARWLADMAS